MTDTLSPIDLALQAVGDLFFRPPLKYKNYKAYIDDSPYSLNQLPKRMPEKSSDEQNNEDSNSDVQTESVQPTSQTSQQEKEDLSKSTVEIPVLIRMGTKAAKNQKPYADVLGQFLKEKNFGISGSVHSIVSDLLQSQQLGDKSKLPEGLDLSKLEIENTEITENEKFDEASQRLLQWAKLESCLASPSTPFCRLTGGIRPIVYVFDDYSNFLTKNDQNESNQKGSQINTLSLEYINLEKKSKESIEEYYKHGSSSQARTLSEALEGFYLCLNRLALAFDIEAPHVRFEGNPDNRYQTVAKLLDFSKLDQQRNQISAFIIDLEWMPKPEWIVTNPAPASLKPNEEHMGNIAVRLLTQRYPEIPCFIFTGMWSIETLQKSLAAGAAWCFQKPVSHHAGSSSNPEEELNYFGLERHLLEFAKRNYGTEQELYNPEQTTKNALLKKLQNNGALQQLISKQFTAKSVEIIKQINSGKTGAATLFAKPKNDIIFEATRFIKIDSWFNIQKEYLAYQHNIRPVLNNHVAHVIQAPSYVNSNISCSSLGILVSSLAGFPEEYNKLKPLPDLIDKYLFEVDGAVTISRKIRTTLDFVLLPLYQNMQIRQFWVGEEFAPRYKGKMTAIIKQDSLILSKYVSESNLSIKEATEYLDENSGENTSVFLTGWQIERIWPLTKNDDGIEEGGIDLYHPKLKANIEISCIDAGEFNKRFTSPIIRHRMGICCQVSLEINDFKSNKKKLKFSVEKLLNEWNKFSQKESLVDPFEIFNYRNSEISGKFAIIHGDLNLNNILYPENEDAGFLIDFATAKKDGLVAFDIARFEVNIWTEYLMPFLVFINQNISEDRSDQSGLYKLLDLSLGFADGKYSSIDLFKLKLIEASKNQNISDSILIPLLNSLKIVSCVRDFIKEKLKISLQDDEFKYAMTVTYLRYSQFRFRSKFCSASDEMISTLCYLCAVHYFNEAQFIKDSASSS